MNTTKPNEIKSSAVESGAFGGILEGWETLRLRDVCQKIGSGATPRGGNGVYLSQGISLIRSQNVYSNRFEHDGLAFIGDDHAEQLKNVVVEQDDVLLNITGDSVARACQVPPDILPARVNQHVAIIRPRKDVLDPQYLKYYFVSAEMQSYMLGLAAAGATRNALTKGMIESFEIPAPSIDEQRNIARILGALDAKIDLNHRMNETLEQMARAIFKQWFIDFEFPGHEKTKFVNGLPEGWRMDDVGNVLTAVGGGTPSTKEKRFWDGNLHFVTPKDLASLLSPVLVDTERCVTEEGLKQISSGLLPKGTVLLSSRAPVGYLAICEIPVAVNQGFIAMICNKELPNYYVLFWAMENLDTIKSNASGTTFPEISKMNFRPIKAIVPSPEILKKFVEIIEPLYRKIVNNLIESSKLSTIRDTLLPKLMSGEIRVK